MRKTIEFWYEFASTYSYLSAMRIEALASERDVDIIWRPFLLGPIFQAQGWETSPFNIYPAKGRYMVRDLERICKRRGLPFKLPEPFPQHALHAARLALIGTDEGWAPAFTKAVYLAEFEQGLNIAHKAILAAILEKLGLDARQYLERIEEPHVKTRLRCQTDEARERGIFGAPSFITADGELFWGDDRLGDALDWLSR